MNHGGSCHCVWGEPKVSKVDLATAHLTGSLLKRGPVYGYAFQARYWEWKKQVGEGFCDDFCFWKYIFVC